MAKQEKLTDKELDSALAHVIKEQAAWRASRGMPEPPPKEAATLALCRWIGQNCYNRHADRAARR